jgi:PAS domain-containing protein
MSNEIFDEQITLSLRRLEELWQQADNLPKSPPEGWQQADDIPVQPQELLWESLEELTFSLEELRVVVEELHQQNDELSKRNREIEAERQRYQQLFELVPDGYLVTTKEGVILEANQAAIELLKRLGQKKRNLVSLNPDFFMSLPMNYATHSILFSLALT